MLRWSQQCRVWLVSLVTVLAGCAVAPEDLAVTDSSAVQRPEAPGHPNTVLIWAAKPQPDGQVLYSPLGVGLLAGPDSKIIVTSYSVSEAISSYLAAARPGSLIRLKVHTGQFVEVDAQLNRFGWAEPPIIDDVQLQFQNPDTILAPPVVLMRIRQTPVEMGLDGVKPLRLANGAVQTSLHEQPSMLHTDGLHPTFHDREVFFLAEVESARSYRDTIAVDAELPNHFVASTRLAIKNSAGAWRSHKGERAFRAGDRGAPLYSVNERGEPVLYGLLEGAYWMLSGDRSDANEITLKYLNTLSARLLNDDPDVVLATDGYIRVDSGRPAEEDELSVYDWLLERIEGEQ